MERAAEWLCAGDLDARIKDALACGLYFVVQPTGVGVAVRGDLLRIDLEAIGQVRKALCKFSALISEVIGRVQCGDLLIFDGQLILPILPASRADQGCLELSGIPKMLVAAREDLCQLMQYVQEVALEKAQAARGETKSAVNFEENTVKPEVKTLESSLKSSGDIEKRVLETAKLVHQASEKGLCLGVVTANGEDLKIMTIDSGIKSVVIPKMIREPQRMSGKISSHDAVRGMVVLDGRQGILDVPEEVIGLALTSKHKLIEVLAQNNGARYSGPLAKFVSNDINGEECQGRLSL